MNLDGRRFVYATSGGTSVASSNSDLLESVFFPDFLQFIVTEIAAGKIALVVRPDDQKTKIEAGGIRMLLIGIKRDADDKSACRSLIDMLQQIGAVEQAHEFLDLPRVRDRFSDSRGSVQKADFDDLCIFDPKDLLHGPGKDIIPPGKQDNTDNYGDYADFYDLMPVRPLQSNHHR